MNKKNSIKLYIKIGIKFMQTNFLAFNYLIFGFENSNKFFNANEFPKAYNLVDF